MFKTALCVESTNVPDLWFLTAPLIFERLDDEIITVPAGFISDLASVPHIMDWIPFLDRTGASRRPAALHDWSYASLRWRGKEWCDDLLYEALMAEGMTSTQAEIYRRAVRWFGASAWANDGLRHPWDVNPSNLESNDFISEATWQAWIATLPTPNEDNPKR